MTLPELDEIDERWWVLPFALSEREIAELDATKPEVHEWFLAQVAHAHLYRCYEQARAPSVKGGFLLGPHHERALLDEFEAHREAYVALAREAYERQTARRAA